MPLAYDTAGPSSAGAAGTTSPLTWSHTVTGTGDTLLVGVACDTDSATVTSVTWGAATLAPLTAGAGNYIHSNGQTAGWIAVFKLVNAAPGTSTVTVTFSANTVAEGGSLSFSGSDTVTGTGTPVTAVGATAAPTVTVSSNTSGNLIAAFLVNGNFISSASTGTSRFINNTGGSNAGGHIAGLTIPATGSPVACTWAVTADWYAVVAVEVLAGGGATASAGAAAGAGAALNAAILTSNVNVGPFYATAASDLGGVYGSWNTPQYAEGGP